jgi:chemotaxis methyl-accepting protein methylase
MSRASVIPEPGAFSPSEDSSTGVVAPKEAAFLDKVREFLLRSGSLDIAPYQKRYLLRRLAVRQRALGLPGSAEYLRHLEETPEELPLCLEALTINVTEFFRDLALWEFLRRDLFPALATEAEAEGRGVLRAWSAGCASGEEAFSLAILLSVALESTPGLAWEVLGTDVDEGALRKCREALYPEQKIESVPKSLRPRHFVPAGRDGWRVVPRLQTHVKFFRQDLLCESIKADMDIILCRNVLMYFDAPLQTEILKNLDACLRPGGRLVLGPVDRLGDELRARYEVVSAEHKVFRKPLS